MDPGVDSPVRHGAVVAVVHRRHRPAVDRLLDPFRPAEACACPAELAPASWWPGASVSQSSAVAPEPSGVSLFLYSSPNLRTRLRFRRTSFTGLRIGGLKYSHYLPGSMAAVMAPSPRIADRVGGRPLLIRVLYGLLESFSWSSVSWLAIPQTAGTVAPCRGIPASMRLVTRATISIALPPLGFGDGCGNQRCATGSKSFPWA